MPPLVASVAIVADRAFGAEILELAARTPVWVCDTPVNRPWIEKVWNASPKSKEHTVTAFTFNQDADSERIVLDQLSIVDLHHGEYSAQAGWSGLEVFGSPLSLRLREALAGYGVDHFTETVGGFVCSRSRSS